MLLHCGSVYEGREVAFGQGLETGLEDRTGQKTRDEKEKQE